MTRKQSIIRIRNASLRVGSSVTFCKRSATAMREGGSKDEAGMPESWDKGCGEVVAPCAKFLSFGTLVWLAIRAVEIGVGIRGLLASFEGS